MPLITWTVLGYALTLIIGLSADAPTRTGLGAAALVASIVLLRRRPVAAALVASIVAAAALMASATLLSDASCVATIGAQREWDIGFEADAVAGSLARGLARDGQCTLKATLLVVSGRAHAGQRATVRGDATVGASGLFIKDAVLDDIRGAGVLAMLRAATARRIDRIFGVDAPMVAALVIGDMSGIPAAVRDRYARAGLVHMLSVSGLHVGIIAFALELIALVARAPMRPARIATLCIMALYVIAIGAPPPAVRAAVMLAALLLTRLMQRPTSRWAILALGAGVPLADPHVAVDLGWQLSVAGTAALVGGGALAKRLVPRRWSSTARNLSTAMVISIVATLATAPLVAWTFGRVALLGPVTNLLADPIMGLLQPLLFIGVMVPVPAVEHWAADASHALLVVFDSIGRVAAQVPFAAPVAMPSRLGAVAAGAASVSLLAACCMRHPARPAMIALLSVGVLVAEPMLPMRAGVPELHMLDVGQGDAIAIRTSRGRWIVVDAGRVWPAGDAGKSIVAPYIAQRGGDIALFVLSHAHADHVGGAASLFALRRPARFLDPGFVGTSSPYRAALDAAIHDGIPWTRARPGETITVDDVAITTLAPDSAWAASLADANLASTILLAHLGNARVLLTGDAEGAEEDWLLAHYADSLHADVLKVGHHGSSTSTTPPFLAAVHPGLALVSVGAHNAYGHPSAEIMEALRAAGAVVARTDQLGTMVLRFPPHAIELRAAALEWRHSLVDTH